MRSRTEMVTTTFVDSEEDYSDDDDSEEDWRPSASNKNGKKQKHQKGTGGGTAKRGRKRKGSSVALNKNSKRKPAYDESDDYEEDEASEDEFEFDDYDVGSGPSEKKPSNLPPKKQFSDKNSSHSGNSSKVGDIINLLVYVKDLIAADPNFNNRLCLWRKDSNNLLQKYIRVKTAPDQFLFTSSSVYSSFDDKRISDFHDIKVKSIDSTYRRVKILNPSELHNITKKCSKNNKTTIVSDERKDNLKKNYQSFKDYIEQDDDEDVEDENEKEQEDCNAERDDDEYIEDDDEAGDD